MTSFYTEFNVLHHIFKTTHLQHGCNFKMGPSKDFRCFAKNLLFLFILSISLKFSEQKRHRAYNERCVPYDSSTSCDSNQGLICLDSGLKGYRCLCPSNKLHSQVYDHKRSMCVGKVFNACVLNGKTKSSALNESLCVENAVCEKMFDIPVCQCKAGFVEMDNLCVPALKYGDVCSDPSVDESASSSTTTTPKSGLRQSLRDQRSSDGGKCDEKHGQICLEGKCQCRYPSEQYYDSKEGKCISYANGRCTHGHGDGHMYSCVPNARCNAPPYRVHSSTNLNPTIGLLPPLPPFLGGLVQAAAAASSSSSSSRDGDDMDEDTTIFMMPLRPRLPPPPPHHPPFPPHGHHHHHHQAMLSREDPLMEFDTRFDNFDFGRSIFFGESGSKKGEREDQDQARCQCMPGYSKTSTGFCMLGYRSKCYPEEGNDSKSNTPGEKTCNPDQFLECMDASDVDGKFSFQCQCRNPLNERYNGSVCVAMIGRRCSPSGPSCETFSECIDGVCQCGNGTSFNPMKESCMKNYGQGCEPGQCNGYKGLTCGKSRTCECVDSYLKYDTGKGMCVSSKGGVCGSMKSRADMYVGCEDGSECKSQESDGKKVISRCI